MHRLLVATDLSDRARKALERGLELARRFEAHLTVLHVVDPDQPLKLRDEALRSRLTWLEEELERHETAELDLAIEVLPGPADGTIVELAAQTDAELIVMGAHRRHLLRDVFVGTTIERVIRGTERPVLMVNREADRSYEKALVALDFSAISERAITAAEKLGYLGASDVILLHAYQPVGKTTLAVGGVDPKIIETHTASTAAEAMSALRLTAGRHDARDVQTITLHTLVEEGPPLAVIERVAEREAAPLVVIGSHSHTGVLRFLLGSTAESYLRTTTMTDVLVVSPPAGAYLRAAPDRS